MSVSSIQNNSYGYIASGTSINTAADNPAGMAISQELQSQATGYSQGTKNAQAGQDVISTADGALSSITDSLQRIRELSTQASNTAIYGDDDRTSMQEEVEQLKQQIQETAKNTQYNTKKLLDGSMASMDLATNPAGGGLSIQLTNSTLESLGIKDYDVTGNFDVSVVDKALENINSSRASLGAQSSALNSTISSNTITESSNLSSQNTIEGLDVGKAVSDQKKEDVLQQYQFFAMKQRTEQEQNAINALLK